MIQSVMMGKEREKIKRKERKGTQQGGNRWDTFFGLMEMESTVSLLRDMKE